MISVQIVTIRLSYKLQWPEQRMIVNESAAWGKEGEINISPDNIEVRTIQYRYFTKKISRVLLPLQENFKYSVLNF